MASLRFFCGLVTFSLYVFIAGAEPEIKNVGVLPSFDFSASETPKTIEEDHDIRMRDNTTRYTRVFFNETRGDKIPVLFVQCPYPISFHDLFIGMWQATTLL